MSDDQPPWEPPVAGTEVEHLMAAINRMRATFRWKADGLDAAGLAARLPSSTLSLGGLLKHLAVQEDYTATVKLSGDDMDGPWPSPRGWDDDWEFTSAADDSPETLYALYDDAVARADQRFAAALASGGLDGDIAVAWPDGRHANLRRLLFDHLEEYGRHTGQADLIREAVDGRTGEDPPADWRTASGWPGAQITG